MNTQAGLSTKSRRNEGSCVELGKVDRVEVLSPVLLDLVFEFLMLFLKFSNLDSSHTSCFFSKKLTKLQVISDRSLSSNLDLDFVQLFIVAFHFCKVSIFTLCCKSHLSKFVENFEMHKEISVCKGVFSISDEILDITDLTLRIVVYSVRNSSDVVLSQLLRSGSSHNTTIGISIEEIFIICRFVASACISSEHLG